MPLSVDESKRIRLWGRCLRSSAAPRASRSCALAMRSPFRSTSFPGSRTKAPNRCHFASSPPAIRREPSMPSFGIAKRELLPCPIPRFTALPRSWAALVELNDTKGTKVPGPLWRPPRIASSRRFSRAKFKITCDRCDKDRMRKEGHAPDIYADDHAALYDRSQACRTHASGCAEHRGCNQHFKCRCNVVAASYP